MNQLNQSFAKIPIDDFRWNVLQRKVQESKIRRAFALFREQNIEPILIKGWAVGVFYPSSHFRFSIDIDLAVSADQFPAAEKIVRAASNEGLAIDLHRELRHLDSVSWTDLFQNSLQTLVEGYPIRVLRIEDHLRVLCIHWLTDGGVNKERLWDIYYIIHNRRPDFEWERFLGMVAPHRRKWLICCVGLAAKYLALDLANTPITTTISELPSWLIQAVESEWSAETKHLPLEATITSPKMLIRQIKKRIRPNPVWATIQMDGSFDSRTRLHYQLGSLLRRIGPSSQRILSTIKQLSK